jgi:predicted HicB family RNase H-like nuclease
VEIVKRLCNTFSMATKKKKMGRPSIPKRQYRGIITTVRLKPEERQVFEQEAEKEGLTLSEWIRQTLKKIVQGRNLAP